MQMGDETWKNKHLNTIQNLARNMQWVRLPSSPYQSSLLSLGLEYHLSRIPLGLIDQPRARALGLVRVALALRLGREHGRLLVGLGALDLLALLALGGRLVVHRLAGVWIRREEISNTLFHVTMGDEID
jgi:hypothetical protein